MKVKLEKHRKENEVLAKNLRKNMTPEERKLWYEFLRNYPIRFKRQKMLGIYIADFYCAEAKLVIELDGSQHYTEEGKKNDEMRTAYLNSYGIKVIRFKNYQITDNFSKVCEHIDLVVKTYVNERDM